MKRRVLFGRLAAVAAAVAVAPTAAKASEEPTAFTSSADVMVPYAPPGAIVMGAETAIYDAKLTGRLIVVGGDTQIVGCFIQPSARSEPGAAIEVRH